MDQKFSKYQHLMPFVLDVFTIATRSKAERKTNGALVLHKPKATHDTISMWRKVSEGCNGVQSQAKHEFVDEYYNTLSHVLHAEYNALNRIPSHYKVSRWPGHMYDSHEFILISQTYPCPYCLEEIARKKTLLNIVAVLYVDAYREYSETDYQRMQTLGIDLVQVPDEALVIAQDQAMLAAFDIMLSSSLYRKAVERITICCEKLAYLAKDVDFSDLPVFQVAIEPVSDFRMVEKIFYSIITAAKADWGDKLKVIYFENNIRKVLGDLRGTDKPVVFKLTDNVNNYCVSVEHDHNNLCSVLVTLEKISGKQ
jgi:deoxycytidylate deaminase